MSTLNDNEEDLDDFPAKNREKPAESMVGTYRAESTDACTAGSGITTKIPSFFDGSTSCLKYEELIVDWLDLTVLEAEKRGPTLKNRLVGDAEMNKGLLDRENLKTADGVKYFRDTRDTLRPHFIKDFIKGAQSVFLWRFYQLKRARRGHIEMVKWIGKFSLLLTRLKNSWTDMPPMSTLSEEQRENQYLADVAQENADRQNKKCRTFGSELTSDSRQMECYTGEQPRKAFSIQ